MSQSKPTDQPRGTITKDQELAAMNKIVKELNGLADDQKRRVIRWVVSKYAPLDPPKPLEIHECG